MSRNRVERFFRWFERRLGETVVKVAVRRAIAELFVQADGLDREDQAEWDALFEEVSARMELEMREDQAEWDALFEEVRARMEAGDA